MRISEHFTTQEWTCRCGCGQTIKDSDLIQLAELIRNHFKKPVIVHCVNRCPKHNAEVGGVPDSQHILGKAMDFHVKGISMKKLHEEMLYLYTIKIINNLGLYDWGCHVDVRDGRTYWDSRGKG